METEALYPDKTAEGSEASVPARLNNLKTQQNTPQENQTCPIHSKVTHIDRLETEMFTAPSTSSLDILPSCDSNLYTHDSPLRHWSGLKGNFSYWFSAPKRSGCKSSKTSLFGFLNFHMNSLPFLISKSPNISFQPWVKFSPRLKLRNLFVF